MFGIFWGINSASHSLAIDQILVASSFDSVSAYPVWLSFLRQNILKFLQKSFL